MLVPLFSTIATPMTTRNSTGSNQEVVVMQRIRKIKTTARPMIRCISSATFSARDLLWTAMPT